MRHFIAHSCSVDIVYLKFKIVNMIKANKVFIFDVMLNITLAGSDMEIGTTLCLHSLNNMM